MVGKLIERGAEPNLQMALHSGTLGVLELILTAITPMTEAHHQQIISWMKTLKPQPSKWPEHNGEVVKLLLDFGLDPNLCRPTAPHSPLIVRAASYDDLGLLQKLIARGAKLDVKDDYSDPALICAAKNHHRQIYDALKAAGVNDSYFLFGTVWGTYARS